MTILADRDITPVERVAIADEPRPGAWVEFHEVTRKVVGQPVISRLTGQAYPTAESIPEWRGDGKRLDQHQTDILIVTELHRAPYADQAALVAAIGWPVKLQFRPYHSNNPLAQAFEQRGGIHSDPLVRLLAFRAWGERDRTWRKRDTWRALMAAGGVNDAIIYGFSSVSTRQVERDARRFVQVTAERGRQTAQFEYEPGEDTSEQMLEALDSLDAALAGSPTWAAIQDTASARSSG